VCVCVCVCVCVFHSCGVRGCKMKNVTLLGRVCPFCNLRYCNSHAMAEQHGCGADAKVRALRDRESVCVSVWYEAVQKNTPARTVSACQKPRGLTSDSEVSSHGNRRITVSSSNMDLST